MTKTAFNQFLREVKNRTYPNRIAARRRMRNFDDFLKHVTSVVHVGAHDGQERDVYARYGLDVLWIEPIPEVFDRLVKNISKYPKQKAVRALVTDQEGGIYKFNFSSNDFASSSIFDFKGHKKIWPNIDMVKSVEMKSRILDSIIAETGGRYDALVMDTQGSELLVLKGAQDLLKHLRFVKTEAADFEIYSGCTNAGELTDYLGGFGFHLTGSAKSAETQDGGSCYDLVFSRSTT